MEIHPIAHIQSDFKEKFGIPRQSGLVEALRASIIFTPPYRVPDAVRGLEEFSHIWLVWEFSQARREGWSPTVRPPRLGGNARLGVFATRSPFRPNALGLSAVRLEAVEADASLGPTEDGGYYLVGLKKPCRALFAGQAYGHESVYENALAAIRGAGLRFRPAPPCRDVDVPEDLCRLPGTVRPDSHTARLLKILEWEGRNDG